MYNCKGFQIFDGSAPSYMSEMFLPVGQSRITRRSKNKLNQPFRKTNIGQNCLSYLGPKIWNNLPSELKSATNINSFKYKIKDKFFNDLQSQDDSPTYIIDNLKSAYEKIFSQHFFLTQDPFFRNKFIF